MEIYIITIGLMLLAVAGIAIKIWAKKDGTFAGTCASQSPFLNKEGASCGFAEKHLTNLKIVLKNHTNKLFHLWYYFTCLLL